MAIGGPRTLSVRCTTWDQVEVFYTRKLRKGKLLSMKVPFQTDVGAPVTLGLELPNQVVMAIEGVVHKASAIGGDTKTWIEVELVGLTQEVLGRIKAMAAGVERPRTPSPPPPLPQPAAEPKPPLEELPSDERELFQHLSAELRRMRQLAVHEVLGVERDAEPADVRTAWMTLMRRHHPDLVARHNAAAVSHLAEELTILANRAYDRLRVALVAEGRATSHGSVLQPPVGWLVGFEDISSADQPPRRAVRAAANVGTAPVAAPVATVTSDSIPPPLSAAQGGEAFEARARAMLGDGDAANAQEVLAAALCVYPRSRPLRSLYYVASALSALQKGELMLATSQLETALAHHESCSEAAALLEHVRKHGDANIDDTRRLFR
jgi:DnaJ-domain-containing protein 1